MITFNTTPPKDPVAAPQPEQQAALSAAPEPVSPFAPKPSKPKLLVPLLVVSFMMFALGAGGTLIYVNTSSETAQPAPPPMPTAPVATTLSEEAPEDVTAAVVEQPEEAVMRADTTPALFETSVEDPKLGAAARAVCLQTLEALLASGSGAQTQAKTSSNHLDLARALAREVQGCTMVSITVQGHFDGSFDEVENLRASWQQAEETISALAAEGLDVSRFRPLGFGSRSLAEDAGADSRSVSFHIAVES